ncbi:MAG TPA: hypothetical protein VLG50_07730 [Candidatus Saccharimonadales bacterium]|nr:hypothetical protein [Candidatus Saccharimonadales bacterium]
MLTNSADVDEIVLSSLSYHDLSNVCFSNQYYYHVCHQNIMIQKKLKLINKIVMNVMREASIISIVYPSQPMTIYDMIKFMLPYKIDLMSDPPYQKDSIIVEIKIFYPISTTYFIQYKYRVHGNTKLINTSFISTETMKEFLFYLFYDDIIKQ